jgi:gamma-glutamyltranspeptidase/glutathione hydrolase
VRFANGESSFIDFRERAPLAASRNMYLGADGKPTRDSVKGWRASGVPGTVRGLEYAHRKWGRKPWGELVAPAVKLAADGFDVPFWLSRSLQSTRALEDFPDSKRIFLKDGAFLQWEERFRQPELSATLSRIAREGARDFYEGQTAQILAEEMKARGGLITLEDLREYRPVERKPLQGSYKDYAVLTAPPPSSGGIGMLQMLGVLEGTGYEKTGAGSAESIHFLAEAMRRFYADRSEHFGDPDFFRVPVAGLLSKEYVARLRASIDRGKATPSEQVRPGKPAARESEDTTHMSIVDAEGNAAALTYTLNGSYGSGVTVPKLGLLLNNEMDDFAAQPGTANMFGLVQGEGNAIAPKKRPLSSMTPTIVMKDGRVFMVIGAPGGGRIITGVTQAVLNVLDFKMNMQQAIDAPRFHHQWQPDELQLESGFSPDTVALLGGKGHAIGSISNVALVEAIMVEGGILQGASDGRAHGKAVGW